MSFLSAKKMHTRHAKDMLDIEALKDKVDERKIAEAKKYSTTLPFGNSVEYILTYYPQKVKGFVKFFIRQNRVISKLHIC